MEEEEIVDNLRHEAETAGLELFVDELDNAFLTVDTLDLLHEAQANIERNGYVKINRDLPDPRKVEAMQSFMSTTEAPDIYIWEQLE